MIINGSIGSTQAALRDIIGNNELDFVLTERESIAQSIKEIVVANLVRPGDIWTGIPTDGDVAAIANQFLETIE
jgi:hypothetical protein